MRIMESPEEIVQRRGVASFFRHLLSRISLRAGLLLLLGVIAVVLLTDQITQIFRDRDKDVTRAKAELTSVAGHAARRQADMVGEARALLRVVSAMPEIANETGDTCHQTLRGVVTEVPWLSSMTRFRPDGHATCSSYDTLPSIWAGDRAYFINALATRDFVLSDYIISRVTGKPALIGAMPRVDAGGITSVLIGVVDLDWLSRLAADAQTLPGSVVLLMDRQMTVLAAFPNPKDWIGRPISNSPDFRDFIGSERDEPGLIEFNGQHWVVAHQRLADGQGHLVALQPESIVLEGANRDTRVRLVKISLIAFCLILAVWLGGEYLVVRPISDLSGAAARLGSGDLAARVRNDIVARDFHVLGEAFNAMAADFEERDQELQAANKRLEELASTDGLTGLANRRLFDQTLAIEWLRAQREGKCIAIIQLDVDHFKLFNDRYGHLAGDDCLRAVAAVLATGARRPGDVVGRTGGEEFTLLLPDAGVEHATMIAERLRQRVYDIAVPHEGNSFGRVTISAGVASTRPARGSRPEIVVGAADRALYRAKRSGRNRVEAEEAVAAEGVAETAAA